jgi:hypothetical protein
MPRYTFTTPASLCFEVDAPNLSTARRTARELRDEWAGLPNPGRLSIEHHDADPRIWLDADGAVTVENTEDDDEQLPEKPASDGSICVSPARRAR